MEPFFLPVAGGQRFCMFYRARLNPGEVTKGQVVYAHPFAEEMNKSRRMAAIQSRSLALEGFDVLQIDLLGCGDSSGDFGDATWSDWVSDLEAGCRWIRARHEKQYVAEVLPALWLWGLRAGCLLAAQAAQNLQFPCNFLFWAPTLSGKTLLQQFFRLKAAADLASGGSKAVLARLRSDLAQGCSVEIAGYVVAPSLAHSLELATLSPVTLAYAMQSRVEWFELSTRADATLSPAGEKSIAAWEQAGYALRAHVVSGPGFWQTSEIEDAQELVSATSLALKQAVVP